LTVGAAHLDNFYVGTAGVALMTIGRMKAVATSGALAFLISSGAVQAISVYAYTGNNYNAITDNTLPSGTYTTSMSVSGTFTLANPLAANLALTDITADVLGFSFFDGRNTITNATAFADVFRVGTTSAGTIAEWEVVVQTAPATTIGEKTFFIYTENSANRFDSGRIFECTFAVAGTCTATLGDLGTTSDHPGLWTRTDLIDTPLPGAVPLFASGLVGLGLLGWRRKRKDIAA
jgi:hypothetical protein